MIENEDMEMLKEVFVTRSECGRTSGDISKKSVEINLSTERRIAKIEAYQKVSLWVLTAVGGGVISILLQMILGG